MVRPRGGLLSRLIPRVASRGHTRREGSLGPDGGSAHCWAWLPIRAVAVDADRAIARQQPRVPATPLMVPVETEPEACSDLNEGPVCQLPSQRVLRAPPVASAPSTTVSAWPPAGLLPSEQALPLEAVMTAPQPSGRLATPRAWPRVPPGLPVLRGLLDGRPCPSLRTSTCFLTCVVSVGFKTSLRKTSTKGTLLDVDLP